MTDAPPFPFKPGDHQIGGIWVDAKGNRITYDAKGRKTPPTPDVRPNWTCWRDRSHRVATDLLFGWPRCAECPAAPQYWERKPDPSLTLLVFVPADSTGKIPRQMTIAKGSAIVGIRLEHNLYKISFEGNIHNPLANLELDKQGRFESALIHAADRLVTDYPSVAVTSAAGDDLMAVGTYNPTTKELAILDEEHLNEWLEGTP